VARVIEHRRPDRVFAAIVLCAYVPVALFAIGYHEMWRDELHCWLVARDAATPWAVVQGRAYDGQPPLWYLLLWLLQRVTSDPRAMQAMHVVIACAVVWVFAAYAPLPRWMRALFPFGYFLAYEYVALSRCYGLALLLALLICVRHAWRFERPLATSLLCAALALTTTVATMVVAAYAAALGVEWIGMLRRRDPRAGRAAIPIASSLAAGLFAAACTWPPADSTVAHVGWPKEVPDDTAVTRLLVGLFPVPHDDFFFWNSNALMWWDPFRRIALWVSLAVAAWIVFLLWRERTAAILFSLGSLLLVALFALVYGGDVRHHGFFYVLFLMAAWIARARGHVLAGFRGKALYATLAVVLLAQIGGTPIALYWDTKYVFSSGKRAADALRARGLADALLVAEVDYPAIAVLGQLGPHAVAYSPRNGRTFSYVRWTRDRKWDPTDEQTLAYTESLGRQLGQDPVLVMNRPLRPELVDGQRVERLAELYDSMIEEENFYLYRVRSTPGPTVLNERP
jgi:hypothetical protein